MPDSSHPIGSQCDRCQFYAFSEYLVCSLHPTGPIPEHRCHDFDPWPEEERIWIPMGIGLYGGATPQQPHRASPRLSRQSLREKLEQIEAHPIFSGHCPQCGHPLGDAPQDLWTCSHCGWQDCLEDD